MKIALFALALSLIAAPALARDDEILCETPAGQLTVSFAEQIAACTRLLNGNLTAENRAIVLHNRARSYFDDSQFDRAAADYASATQVNPRYHQAWYGLGSSYNKLGQFAQAIQSFTTAIGLNPGYTNAFLNRGAAYARSGDLPRAVEDFSQAIRLSPTLAIAWRNRSIAYRALGETEKSASDAAEAARLGA
jgi:tetratricopeptide (TPR) repeat protein